VFAFVVVQMALWWRALATLVNRVLRQEANSTVLPYFLVPMTAIVASGLLSTLVRRVIQYFGLLYFSLQG
jgi:hypothetical protein